MFGKACGTIQHLLRRFADDERGATATEYGLIVALISLAIMVTLGSIGETMRDDVFGAVASALDSSESE